MEAKNGQKEQVPSMVAGKAFDVAKANSVDFSQYSLQSIQLLRDGQMGTIDDSASDEYISSVRKELKGKNTGKHAIWFLLTWLPEQGIAITSSMEI